jgi:hypothetical protein
MQRGDPGYFRPSPLDTHPYMPMWAHMLLIKVLEGRVILLHTASATTAAAPLPE